ncbi:MAG TPA: histidine kinase [Puia sp.]|jgi:ligand-binding sensor domain-containing protein|nr:histidine kinase [Puia sp.]
MKWAAVFLLLLVLLTGRSAFSQEYSYTHYDITEGLAGTTAYCITQDADGFIWIGTETGVSRFDGSHFRSFTTGDGLPDIEVLQIFGDSRDRVWMAPFKRSICYYYRGKIYNPENDTLLSRIPLKGNVEGFAEDIEGNVLIAERRGLHLISTDGRVRNIDSINGSSIQQCTAICRSASGHFLVQEGRNIWNFADSFSIFRSIEYLEFSPTNIAMSARGVIVRQNYAGHSYFEDFATGRKQYYSIDRLHYTLNTFSLLNDRFIYFNELWGSTQVDPGNGNHRLFLPGVQVSRAFRDQDGSLWFTTLDHGIYRLNSDEFRSKTFASGSRQTQSVYSIFCLGDTVLAGTDQDMVFGLVMPEFTVADTGNTRASKEKIVFIDTCGKGVIYCSGYGIFQATDRLKFMGSDVIPTKWARRLNREELLIGNSSGVMIYNIRVSWVTDTLYRERSTTGFVDGDTIYFGTINGLYRVNPDRSVVFLGRKVPFLTKRISSMAMDQNRTLWVASYDDAGVIGFRNDSVVAAITKRQGLTSDICRTLLVKGQVLWVGTDKGLNAIRLDRPGYPVIRYTSNDGLGSDMINTLYADDSMIFVGTPAGLSYFNSNRVQTGEPCRLRLMRLINSGHDRIADTGNLALSYRATDIRFEFVGISYRSVGGIRYRYRMLGLDTNWRETGETFLDYPSLPSGKYVFQLQAINKFDNPSLIRSVPFVVGKPFWEQFWFIGLEVAVLVSLIWLFVHLRVRWVRQQQEENSRQSRRMAELEHFALQAQMNPHFIFNCLNSIQQFVFDKDMMATNEYISNFARLIRATLNHSSRQFISVGEEVEYLNDYLSLEKMRFKNKMNYSVEVGTDIDKEAVLLPPMLLQPYVENCVRHGLRHKTNGQGYIRIQFRKQAEKFLVTIRDNGIGRKKAMEFRTGEHIEYQSKGMSLTSSRIEMINTLYKSQIVISVEDVLDENGQSDGTRIAIEFPVFR